MIEEEENLEAGEIGKMVSEAIVSTGGDVRLVAIADLQSYLKWKERQPLLELQWDFEAVSVPSGGPALSLHGFLVSPVTGYHFWKYASLLSRFDR